MKWFSKKYPDWFADVRDKEDLRVLKVLADNGADFSQARELIFCAYVPRPMLMKVAEGVKQYGWSYEVSDSGENTKDTSDSTVFLEIKSDNYFIEPEDFSKDKLMISRIVESCGGQFDGWYASV